MKKDELYRVRLYKVNEDGTETEYMTEDGKVFIGEKEGICTGMCIMTIDETMGKVNYFNHNVDMRDIAVMISGHPIIKQAAEIVGCMKEEFEDEFEDEDQGYLIN